MKVKRLRIIGAILLICFVTSISHSDDDLDQKVGAATEEMRGLRVSMQDSNLSSIEPWKQYLGASSSMRSVAQALLGIHRSEYIVFGKEYGASGAKNLLADVNKIIANSLYEHIRGGGDVKEVIAKIFDLSTIEAAKEQINMYYKVNSEELNRTANDNFNDKGFFRVSAFVEEILIESTIIIITDFSNLPEKERSIFEEARLNYLRKYREIIRSLKSIRGFIKEWNKNYQEGYIDIAFEALEVDHNLNLQKIRFRTYDGFAKSCKVLFNR